MLIQYRNLWRFSAMLVLLAVFTSACSTAEQRKAGGTASNQKAESLQADIEVFRDELPKLHKNLFTTLSKEEYAARLNTMEKKLPQLTDTEAEILLRKLLADIGDSHTNLSVQSDYVYPFEFRYYKEGLYTRAAAPDYSQYVGMELVSLNGYSVAQIKNQLAEIIPHENEAQLWKSYPMYMIVPKFLQGLGIADEKPAEFRFRSRRGEIHTVTVKPVLKSEIQNLYRFLGGVVNPPKTAEEVPLYLRNTDTHYWMEYLQDEKLLYIQYNSCRENPELPFSRFFEQVKSAMETHSIKKLVIDVRFNGGGNSTILHSLIRRMEKDYKSGREYKLYTIIGRYTYSSAVLNAVDLKQRADAVLVGEPTSGRPNHFGEVKTITLPYSGVRLSYSTKYFSRFNKDTDSLRPDREVIWSIERLSEWRDGVMEYIRGQG